MIRIRVSVCFCQSVRSRPDTRYQTVTVHISYPKPECGLQFRNKGLDDHINRIKRLGSHWSHSLYWVKRHKTKRWCFVDREYHQLSYFGRSQIDVYELCLGPRFDRKLCTVDNNNIHHRRRGLVSYSSLKVLPFILSLPLRKSPLRHL